LNLVLLAAEDVISPDRVRLTDARAFYVEEVHRAGLGRTLRVGFLGGLCGEGVVRDIRPGEVILDVALTHEPPAKLPLRVLLALPRPKVMERSLVALTSLGVAEIVLLNAWRVDKSYWGSPKLQDQTITRALHEGLSQARDTHPPRLVQARLFRRYLEDELPAHETEGSRWVAHPEAPSPCPRHLQEPGLATLAIGPEGGWIAAELASFERAGFTSVHLGPRVLRVETALAALIGRLF
jgi:RsmE family RNA methyltransferase